VADIHNIFISHRHEDDHLIESLRSLLKGRGVDIRNSSITSDSPNNATSETYIKSILASGIGQAGKVVVLITPDTKNHDWVNWEIEYANKNDKQIIGVFAPGLDNCEVPESLEKHADAIVNWDADKIQSALNGERPFTDETGNLRGPQGINRVGC
jgi:MTH538 TIR-like domain (DUF1863)